jgi:hypothetical protein
VDDPRVVGHPDGACERDHELGGLPARLGRSPQAVIERASLEQLERHERQAVDLADLVYLDDVGMAKQGDCLGLDAEPAEVIGPRVAAAPDHLHRNQAVQSKLPGQEDHAHSPLAEFLQ